MKLPIERYFRYISHILIFFGTLFFLTVPPEYRAVHLWFDVRKNVASSRIYADYHAVRQRI